MSNTLEIRKQTNILKKFTAEGASINIPAQKGYLQKMLNRISIQQWQIDLKWEGLCTYNIL